MLDILILIIFAVIVIPRIRKEDVDCESLYVSSCTGIKGISSIAIFFNHFTGWFLNFGPIMFICVHWGTQVVAVFFFLSSYGLYHRYNGKKLKFNFLLKRFLKIFISYWICEFVYCIVSLSLHIRIKTTITLRNIFVAFFGLASKSEIVENAWFVTAIVVMYIVFFACSNLFPKVRLSVKILVVSVLLILLTRGKWLSGFAAFFLGVLIAEDEKILRNYFQKKWIACLIISSAIVALFVIIKFKGQSIDSIFIMNIADIISSMFVPVIVYLVMMKIRINNRITNFLGKISYEIYLIHGLAIRISYKVWQLENPIMFCLFAIAISVSVALVINIIAGKIEKPLICKINNSGI